MSPRTVPALGSLAIQSHSQSSQLVHVSPATCHNLSLFKELLKEYRKLDDTVTMRINRTTAQFRDRDRMGPSGKGSVQEQACSYLWQELVENWKRRAELIDYCVDITNETRTRRPDQLGDDSHPSSSLGVSDEAKSRQVRNELAVEKIVRRRSLDAFISRCRFFEPPASDEAARRWWNEAQRRH